MSALLILVFPAKAGSQSRRAGTVALDPRFRGGDGESARPEQ
jgi:hypothetical protein